MDGQILIRPTLHTALHCTALHCTADTALHCIVACPGPTAGRPPTVTGTDGLLLAPHCAHCTALHCTALHCTALHSTPCHQQQQQHW
jgi:hypothetical protein